MATETWQYAVVTLGNNGAWDSSVPDGVETSRGSLDKVLNDLGRDGFELVAMSGGSAETAAEFYLKRPTPTSNPARAVLDHFGA